MSLRVDVLFFLRGCNRRGWRASSLLGTALVETRTPRSFSTMKYGLVVILVICAAGLMYWLKRKNQPAPESADAKTPSPYVDPKDWLDSRNLGIRTASQADERAARLLPMKGTEDVSSLLVRPKLAPEEEPDYGPREAVEWVIDIAAGHDGVFKRSQILAVFDRSWREKNGLPTIYGRATADKKWTYVDAAGVPDDYDQLALGVDLKPDCPEPLTESRLNEIVRATEAAAKRLGAASTKTRLPAKVAADRARELDALLREHEDARAVVLLAAPEGKTFDGKTIWDALMSLGLRWGDMDEFHWENNDRSRGDDHLFSVSSSTEPGYFLPEEIAAGRLHVSNLVFDFSIPRSADPKVVLEGMLAAATYAQKRLGGALVDGEGGDLNPDVLRNQVANITARLTKAGFPPGHDATMRLF
ncbi:MAG: hypothetical protein HY901_07135 [Deltaproteobacteria bacterium]|nr:hypothetical protein [Deltaproteobacteria bacterium]